MRMAERGWEGGSHPNVAYTADALFEFLRLFPQILGSVLLGLMSVGIAALWFCIRPKSIRAEWAVLFALLLAVWVFHSIVPAGVEDRKLIIAVPAMVLFVLAGAVWVADRVPPGCSLSMALFGGVLYRRYKLLCGNLRNSESGALRVHRDGKLPGRRYEDKRMRRFWSLRTREAKAC